MPATRYSTSTAARRPNLMCPRFCDSARSRHPRRVIRVLAGHVERCWSAKAASSAARKASGVCVSPVGLSNVKFRRSPLTTYCLAGRLTLGRLSPLPDRESEQLQALQRSRREVQFDVSQFPRRYAAVCWQDSHRDQFVQLSHLCAPVTTLVERSRLNQVDGLYHSGTQASGHTQEARPEHQSRCSK